MRKFVYILILFIAASQMFSCKDDSTNENDVTIYYKTKNINLLDDDTVATIRFTANTEWYVSIDTSYKWLYAVQTSGEAGQHEITIITEQNESYDERKAYVVIKGPNNQTQSTVFQKGRQIIEFNDPNFEAYCLDNFDFDQSGFVTTAEAHKAKAINCPSLSIGDFTGLEFFKNIEVANLSSNNVVTLSVAKLTELTKLDISQNASLGGLEIGENLKKLVELDCSKCNITSLSVDSCKVLKNLNCSYNSIGSLNLTSNQLLSSLDCRGNIDLTSIFILENQTISDVKKDDYTQFVLPSKIINIPDPEFRSYLLEQFDKNRDNKISVDEALVATDIRCFGKEGQIRDIYSLEGIEYFPNIITLDCSYSNVQSLNLTGNPKLRSISCNFTQISELQISAYSPLEVLDCSDCENLTYLSLNKNSHLKTLVANRCRISAVDFDFCSSLERVDIKDNEINNINFVSTEKLHYVNCANNNIQSLRILNCDSLAFLFCQNNEITDLDIDAEDIWDINCSNNLLSGTLDLSEYVSLHSIQCDTNMIEDVIFPLDESTYLTTVSFNMNNLSDVDLSGLTELRYIYMEDNDIEDIDVSGCGKLEKAYLSRNNLQDTVSFRENRNINQIFLKENPNLETIIAPKGVEPLEIRKDDTAEVIYK